MQKKEEKIAGQDSEQDFVKWLSELDKESGKIAGGKGANLAEMYNAKMPVPPAFVITAQAYAYFIEKTGLNDEIIELVESIDPDNTKQLEEIANKIRELIKKQKMPQELKEEITESYETLSFPDELETSGRGKAAVDALSILKTAKEPIFVAVRSSATTEDLAEASFAGQQETLLNIKGNDKLIEAVKRCFASLFTARAVYYRAKKGFKHQESLIAVIVQKMINSGKSGVIFTNDPVKYTKDIIVEAVYGLGEGIVSGAIKPDYYVLSRELKIKDKKISEKKIAFVRTASGETKKIKLRDEKSKQQVLTDSEIRQLGVYAVKLEEHYEKPQDIEFAIDKEIYIVQTRAITTLKEGKEKQEIGGKILLEGIPASQGIAFGKVKIVHDLVGLNKVVKGDVLVTEMTNPDMVVTMQRAAAIVTDEGGVTAHAAIVSREMGIPCVVGTREATQKLKDGTLITVNGFTGAIYEGKAKTVKKEILPIIETKTKIKVMVDLPGFAERAAKTKCKDVGLLRLEGIIAGSGKHPILYLKEKNIQEYTKLLQEGIEKISQYFNEIWIRTSDIRTDEFENLEGAPEKEDNPMLGMHGIRFGLKNPELFKAEIMAIKNVAEKFPNKKLGIMFPQIISVQELRQAKEIIKQVMQDTKNIKIGAMIETPASVQIIRELNEEGLDFISFGTNDLTQYTLAIDRNNEYVQYLYDEMNPAVLSKIKYVINQCKKYKIETSICGQAGSNKDMVKFLIGQGIDSISVNADSAAEISKFVQQLEQEKEPEIQEKTEQQTKEEKPTEEKKEEKTEEKEEIREQKIEEKPAEEKLEKEQEWSEDIEYGFDPLSDARKPIAEKKEQIEQEETEESEQVEKPEEIKEEQKEQKIKEEKTEEPQEEKQEIIAEEVPSGEIKTKESETEEKEEKQEEKPQNESLNIF